MLHGGERWFTASLQTQAKQKAREGCESFYKWPLNWVLKENQNSQENMKGKESCRQIARSKHLRQNKDLCSLERPRRWQVACVWSEGGHRHQRPEPCPPQGRAMSSSLGSVIWEVERLIKRSWCKDYYDVMPLKCLTERLVPSPQNICHDYDHLQWEKRGQFTSGRPNAPSVPCIYLYGGPETWDWVISLASTGQWFPTRTKPSTSAQYKN